MDMRMKNTVFDGGMGGDVVWSVELTNTVRMMTVWS